MDDLDNAIREYDGAVRNRAAELIRNGYPPYEAIKIAGEQVRRERREQRRKREMGAG